MSEKTYITEVAKDTINGLYGNGAARKNNLEAAGYNYNEVQAEVNRLCSSKKKSLKKKSLKKKSLTNVLKAIGVSILSIICFYMIYAIVFLVVGLIFLILDKIPIISNIANWLFHDAFIELPSILAAYHITKIIVCVLNKNAKTRVLSFAMIGVYLIAFNALCLILNIVCGGNFILNILMIISGFIYFSKRQDYVEE